MDYKTDVKISIEGIWWDEITTKLPDGTEVIEITEKQHNKIMDKMANLIAGLFLNESGWSGVGYHALGDGDVAWDTGTPPIPPSSNIALESEYFRKAYTAIDYMTAGGAVSPTNTNRVRIKTEFDYGEANGHWIREQAIFGGDATSSLDSGYIFDIIRHTKKYKDSSMKLTRFIQFNLSCS